MSFWTRHMPRGMLLRSSKRTSSIADPRRTAMIEAYERECGAGMPDPIPIESFIDYGRWYQRREVPEVEEGRIESIRSEERRVGKEGRVWGVEEQLEEHDR